MSNNFKRFSLKNIAFNVMMVTIYLLWCHYGLKEIKTEHLALSVIWLSAYYFNNKTRRFIKGFSFFIIFWIAYDAMRAFPNYQFGTVHIAQPYHLEKLLFGISDNGKILTPNEYFAAHHNKLPDFLSGFFYINWVPVPLAFAFYLYLKDKNLFLQFSITFLLVNLTGFVIYYLYPAAPPWYVQKYGFELHIGIPGSRAGLERFDQLIHYPLFKGIYDKNANVLAAIPSLHATYPLIVLYYSIKKRMGWLIGVFALFTLGIWFAAVYSGHHYIIDVLTGIIIALMVLFIFQKALRIPFLKQKLQQVVMNEVI